jgi:hypothetical protein
MPSRFHLLQGLAIAVAAAGVLIWTVPGDANESGGRRNRDRQAGYGDESHHDPQGRGGRGERGDRRGRGDRGDRRGGHAGPGDDDGRRGRPHRRWRRGHTGPEVEIGPGYGSSYGVPGGRIGPPTRPCAESQHAHAELRRLRNLRAQVENGNRVYMPSFGDGPGEWHKVSKLRRRHEEDALLNGNTAGLAEFERSMASIRKASLEFIDSEIGYLENQLGDIDAACP